MPPGDHWPNLRTVTTLHVNAGRRVPAINTNNYSNWFALARFIVYTKTAPNFRHNARREKLIERLGNPGFESHQQARMRISECGMRNKKRLGLSLENSNLDIFRNPHLRIMAPAAFRGNWNSGAIPVVAPG
jgi:hypothetical protein